VILFISTLIRNTTATKLESNPLVSCAPLTRLDGCPDCVARNKILPQLINAFEYSNAGSAILAPVFKIGKRLDSKEYQGLWADQQALIFSSKQLLENQTIS
jgi:hypothetical protein